MQGTYRHSIKAMNTEWEFQLCGTNPVFLRGVAEDAAGEVFRLDGQLSLFEPTSETSDVNRNAGTGPIVVDRRFFYLLQRAKQYSQVTNGAFDITVAPLMRAWKLQGGQGAVPTDDEVQAALSLTGSHMLHLDDTAYTVFLEREGMSIDLGAIGKGYAIDCASALVTDYGVEAALLHSGSSTVYGIGCTLDGDPWKVQVKLPQAPGAWGESETVVFQLSNRALSVSAPHGKWFERDGVRYGHVMDSRTGRPVQGSLLAAVSVGSAEVSDALSTALLGAGKSLLPSLVKFYPDLQAVVVDMEDDKITVTTVGIP